MSNLLNLSTSALTETIHRMPQFINPPQLQIPFTTNSTSQQWIAFIKTLSLAENLIHIVPTVIAFKTAKTKDQSVQSAIKSINDPSPPEYTDYQSIILDWYLATTVPTAVNQLKSGGSLLIVSNPLLNAIESTRNTGHGGHHVEWHICAVYWKGGIVGIFDPNFQGIGGRLQDYPGIQIVKTVLLVMGAKRMAVNEIWIGGGGNTGNDCQEVVRAWVEQQVNTNHSQQLGRWEQNGFVRLQK